MQHSAGPCPPLHAGPFLASWPGSRFGVLCFSSTEPWAPDGPSPHMLRLTHALGADLYTVRDDGEEGLEAAEGPAEDSNIGLLPLMLAQGSDARSTASGSVLAGGHMPVLRPLIITRKAQIVVVGSGARSTASGAVLAGGHLPVLRF